MSRSWIHAFTAALLLSLPSIALSAAPLTREFEKANRFYEQGRFEAAAAHYKSILESGVASPALHFNLANAHFKSGQLGQAILHYRLAQRLAPRDPDIQANLRFARNELGTKRPTPMFERWLGRFRLDELTLLGALALWLCFGLLTVSEIQPRWRRALRLPARITAVSFLLLGFALAWTAPHRLASNEAVVVGQKASIRYGPLPESQVRFTAPPGTELDVRGQKGDWIQVSDPAKGTGWAHSRDLTILSY